MEQMRNSPLGLSTSQAAKALGVSLGTIRRWADMGYLESYRTPGGQRRFSVEQIEQFLETLQQRRGGQQQQQQQQQPHQERLVS
jgi:excisionase family DNA binding protein